MKTIVVSGITLRKGGTLTILRGALGYLSEMVESARCQAPDEKWRVVALVNKRELCDFPNIEYMEVPLKGWMGRLWYEYVTMHRISREIGPVYLWLSMHDVTPRVEAERQAVYFQTSFPFYRLKWRDFRFDPKIPIFAMFTRFYYRYRVQHNRYIIVQQEWLREGLSRMIGVGENRFIVAPPEQPKAVRNGFQPKTAFSLRNDLRSAKNDNFSHHPYTFLYVSTPDCHKNFETLCEAAGRLEGKVGKDKFRVVLTLKGDENRYARWLKKHWGGVSSIDFHGLMDKDTLNQYYREADCLVFPSNVETWGLPVSEYMEVNGGPMILSDLPYAHNTAKGSNATAFFEPDNAEHLMSLMSEVMAGCQEDFGPVDAGKDIKEPKAEGWKELFEMLLR